MTTLDKMLRVILLNPNDDVARLAYADLLEEEGQDERAEFIRVQCELAEKIEGVTSGDLHWRRRVDALHHRERELLRRYWSDWSVRLGNCYRACGNREAWPGNVVRPSPEHVVMAFRRGFVEEVTLTSGAFVGGRCRHCFRGVVPTDRDDNTCPVCKGSGRTEGHARALFRAAPLLQVTLSDREPWFSGASGARYWKQQDSDDEQTCRWALSSCLYDLLHSKELVSSRYVHGGSWKRFENEIAALSALHTAALLWGRRRAWPCPPCEGKGKQKCFWCGETERCTSWDCPLPKENHCLDCHGTGHTVTA